MPSTPCLCELVIGTARLKDTYSRLYTSPGSANNAYVAMATTGKAATALGGVTVHSALNLTMKKDDGGLRHSDLNTYQCAFRDVKAILVGEVSVMGSEVLPKVDNRLHQITQNFRKPFGGLDVYMCGNLHQLPPIKATEGYRHSARQVREMKMEHPWKTLDYHPLVHVFRQNGAAFSSFLMRLGDGLMLSEDDVNMIKSRFATLEEAAAKCPNGIQLFYSNVDFDCYNAHCFKDAADVLCRPTCDNITG